MRLIYEQNKPLEIKILSGDYSYINKFRNGCYLNGYGLDIYFPNHKKEIHKLLMKICYVDEASGEYMCYNDSALQEVRENLNDLYCSQVIINKITENILYKICQSQAVSCINLEFIVL